MLIFKRSKNLNRRTLARSGARLSREIPCKHIIMAGNRLNQVNEALIGLAKERTILANERNSLAYIRTGFSAFVLGIAALKLFEDDTLLPHLGWTAIGIGMVFIILGVVYYPIRKERIKTY